MDRCDLRRTRFAAAELPLDQVGAGLALFRLDSFALTANNVTYAVLGDTLGYWRRFPAREPGWGRVPVWGHAEVVASACPGIEPGERFFGFWPMSRHALLEPVEIQPHGFTDGAAREAGLAAVYGQYQRASDKPDPDAEARTAVLRPLLATSFLVDDWLRQHDLFGAEVVVISSASSKTGLGLAHLASIGGARRLVGLTSARHVEFVESTGAFDRVSAYEDLPSGLGDGLAVYVDLAGDSGVLAAVHGHFGERLTRSVRVGFTHHEASGRPDAELPGPAPELFFAPDHVERRLAEWGGRGFAERLEAARIGFEGRVGATLTIDRRRGADEIRAAWEAAVDGSADPSAGVVCSW